MFGVVNVPNIWHLAHLPHLLWMLLVGTGAGPQISECIRSKGAEENELLLLKGNFVYLPK